MIKKIILIAIFLIILVDPVFADKYYSDKANGYSGYAGATYAGSTAGMTSAEFNQHFNLAKTFAMQTRTFIGDCRKLSKAEAFLLWAALKEFNYSANEAYIVTIKENNSTLTLTLLVVITENGQDCNWYSIGYFI